jgi:hypothetical protein
MHTVSVIALGVLMLHPPREARDGPYSARRNGSYRSPTLRAFFEATTRLPRPSGVPRTIGAAHFTQAMAARC